MELLNLSPTQLRLLAVVLGIVAVGPAIITALLLRSMRRRRRRLARRLAGVPARERNDTADAPQAHEALAERLRAVWDRLLDGLPTQQLSSDATRRRLLLAGMTDDDAPAMLTLSRGAAATIAAIVTLSFVPGTGALLTWGTTALSLLLGYMFPLFVLDGLIKQRQQQIRRAIPDALDLLIVCLEAGISQDAALQRVARELAPVHPALGGALVEMVGRTAAGVSRERAFQLLYERTGVDELRGLISHFAQADSWGTSITTVLRIYSEQLRRDRRINAERRAATASTRMLLPLVLFVFPTLFIVLLGPAALRIMENFRR
jgi:tight adherence protein C